jgi:hypothetical protein
MSLVMTATLRRVADFRQRAEKPLKGFIMALICIASLLAGPTLEKTQGGVFKRLKHA